MIPTFIKSYVAATAVAGRTIVQFAAPSTDSTVEEADSAAVAAVGIADPLGADAGQMLDVHRAGMGEVELGGTVAAGDPLTSDASGKAIKAVAAPGSTIWIMGYADAPGVSGDYIACFISSGVLHEA
tara:strand:+ start:914 stop:1294 length:381 start_codon:yes stop_codon:yes gene_type:complete